MIFLLYLIVVLLVGIALWATLRRKSIREGTRVAAELLDDDKTPPGGHDAARGLPQSKGHASQTPEPPEKR